MKMTQDNKMQGDSWEVLHVTWLLAASFHCMCVCVCVHVCVRRIYSGVGETSIESNPQPSPMLPCNGHVNERMITTT